MPRLGRADGRTPASLRIPCAGHDDAAGAIFLCACACNEIEYCLYGMHVFHPSCARPPPPPPTHPNPLAACLVRDMPRQRVDRVARARCMGGWALLNPLPVHAAPPAYGRISLSPKA